MKIKLQLERRDRNDNYSETILVHIKAMDDGGRYIAFARHTPALIKHLTELALDVPENLLAWKGRNDHSGEQLAEVAKYCEAVKAVKVTAQKEIDGLTDQLVRGTK